ncbi:hypothetical protein [Undibacterium baiyunense]|uniref:Uncharacterized protein n=1 Tax=Undibacterium baiyunense TaxID=2828731 RepID=A0A941DDK8_9BURK|nr:hypothetical protein [Undibacterium baiyunense]MBR7746260.1 hypothetical protein [Undibacterium baiyunense]
MSGYAPAFGKSLTVVKKESESRKVCDRSNLGQSLRDFSDKTRGKYNEFQNPYYAVIHFILTLHVVVLAEVKSGGSKEQ